METLLPWQQEHHEYFCVLKSGEVDFWYIRETKMHNYLVAMKTSLPCYSQVRLLLGIFVPSR